MTQRAKTRILILGGGFAGLSVATSLDRILARDERVEITLVDQENFCLFTPLLAEVPSGSIEAKHIVAPSDPPSAGGPSVNWGSSPLTSRGRWPPPPTAPLAASIR